MEGITTWTELFFKSLQSFGEKFMGALPSILGAFLILLIGWLFAKLVSNAIAKLLKVLKFDTAAEKLKVTQYLEKANVKMTASEFVGKFFYWILLLLVVTSASESLGWDAVSEQISKLISYLPNLLIAIVFFIVGTYIATFIRDLIRGATSSLGISTGRIISSFVFYLLFIVVTLTALNQAGVDTTIITSNLLLILGAILGAAAISYGFASRDILSNLLAGFYCKRTIAVGQEIEVNGIRGKVIEVSSIAVTIRKEVGGKTIIPTHKLITNEVNVFD